MSHCWFGKLAHQNTGVRIKGSGVFCSSNSSFPLTNFFSSWFFSQRMTTGSSCSFNSNVSPLHFASLICKPVHLKLSTSLSLASSSPSLRHSFSWGLIVPQIIDSVNLNFWPLRSFFHQTLHSKMQTWLSIGLNYLGNCLPPSGLNLRSLACHMWQTLLVMYVFIKTHFFFTWGCRQNSLPSHPCS